jgi:hypothetical protein
MAITLSSVHVARAQPARPECRNDSQCPDGYACKKRSSVLSAAVCGDGVADCVCDYKPCASDRDCPAWATCKEAWDGVCPTGSASSCMATLIVTFCVPHADLTCEHDADCGEGYTCTGSESGGLCPFYLEPGEPVTEGAEADAGFLADTCKTCVLKDLSCERDAQCPPNMKCVDPYSHDKWEKSGESPHTVCFPYPYTTAVGFEGDAGIAQDSGASGQIGPSNAGPAGGSDHNVDHASSASHDAGTSPAKPKKDDGGCSATAQGTDGTGAIGSLCLALLSAVALRRRARNAA